MPQSRGELTSAQVERIAAAMQAVEDAHREQEQAIAAALKAGASVREMAAFTGMSTTTIQKIGHMNGWPTETQKRQRDELAAERQLWRKYTRGEWPRNTPRRLTHRPLAAPCALVTARTPAHPLRCKRPDDGCNRLGAWPPLEATT